jgi:hypothetical protein
LIYWMPVTPDAWVAQGKRRNSLGTRRPTGNGLFNRMFWVHEMKHFMHAHEANQN